MSDTTEVPTPRQYKDVSGHSCSLIWLVLNEPEWAENQIRHRDKLETELATVLRAAASLVAAGQAVLEEDKYAYDMMQKMGLNAKAHLSPATRALSSALADFTEQLPAPGQPDRLLARPGGC